MGFLVTNSIIWPQRPTIKISLDSFDGFLRSNLLRVTNTGDVHSSTFRLYSSHQEQESTSDDSPWFKNESMSALTN